MPQFFNIPYTNFLNSLFKFVNSIHIKVNITV